MFTVRQTYNFDPATFGAEYERLFDALPAIATHAYGLAQPLFDALREEPRVRSFPGEYPLEWESAAQRVAVVSKLKRTGNFPFRRSHALVSRWGFTLVAAPALLTYTVENESPEASYVYGSDDVELAPRPQQRFHALTGWQTALPRVQTLFDFILKTIDSELARRAAALGGK